jgi:histidinol phosphatase-like PHP family hydrolase
MQRLSVEGFIEARAMLHSHSTASDGRLSPRDVVGYYRSNGFKVVSVTDHGRITRIETLSDCICIPGVEVSSGRSKLGEPYHIVAIMVEDEGILQAKDDPQELIDRVSSSGGFAFIAHPHWSNLTYEDLAELKGYIGIEIYNTGCEVEVSKGYSLTYWDNILSKNPCILGLAVDDAHRYVLPPIDALGGWVTLLLDEETCESVVHAFRDGRFYSSMGPEIKLLEVSSDYVNIASSPVEKVSIISSNGKGFGLTISDLRLLARLWRDRERRRSIENMVSSIDIDMQSGGEVIVAESRYGRMRFLISSGGITEFSWSGKTGSKYLRIEVIDCTGRRAWSNPIPI